MALEWSEANLSDPSLSGYEGRYYVGQVVHYDMPAGWQGFIHGGPIGGGPWPDQTEACRAVEAAWQRRQAGSTSSRTARWPANASPCEHHGP